MATRGTGSPQDRPVTGEGQSDAGTPTADCLPAGLPVSHRNAGGGPCGDGRCAHWPRCGLPLWQAAAETATSVGVSAPRRRLLTVCSDRLRRPPLHGILCMLCKPADCCRCVADGLLDQGDRFVALAVLCAVVLAPLVCARSARCEAPWGAGRDDLAARRCPREQHSGVLHGLPS